MRRRGFIILWLHVLGDTNGTEVVLVNMQKYRHTSLYKLKVLWQPCVKQTWCCHFSSSVCSLPISVSHCKFSQYFIYSSSSYICYGDL